MGYVLFRSMPIAILCFVTLLSMVIGQDKQEQKRISIDVEAIGRTATLIGRLGKPLGEKIQIRGRWVKPERAKAGYPEFAVTHVNGKQLDKPIKFASAQIEALEREEPAKPGEVPGYWSAYEKYKKNIWSLVGEEWVMVAYENGSIEMMPDEDGEADPVFPVVARPYYYRSFTSKIVAVVISKDTSNTTAQC